jgi:hypothetical protein
MLSGFLNMLSVFLNMLSGFLNPRLYSKNQTTVVLNAM